MADERVDVQFGANTGNLQAGTEQAAATVDTATTRMGADFERLQAQTAAAVNGMKTQVQAAFAQMKTAMSTITSVMGSISLALAGGAVFKSVIGDTAAWTAEAGKLSRQLGVTTDNASALMVAAKGLGISTDQVDGSVKGLVRQLKSNEAGLNKMGIATLDANGHTRNMIDIMLDANKVLLGYKEGKDRDVASMAVYGKAALDNAKFLSLNAKAMEEAKRRQVELGIEVGPKAVAEFKAYRAAMNDINLIFQSVKIQIGNAFMPVLVSLGAWFSSTGPAAILVFGGAIKGIASFVMYLGMGVQAMVEGVKTSLLVLVNTAIAASNALTQALHGNFSGAAKTVGDAWRENGATVSGALDRMTKSANTTNDAFLKMWGLRHAASSKLGSGGGKQYDNDAKDEKGGAGDGGKGGSEAEKSRMAEWENFLEKKKIAEKDYFKDSRDADLQYWESRKQSANLTQAELFAIERKIYEIKKGLAQEGLQAQIQNLKQESDNALAGSQQRIEIARRESDLIKGTYGAKSKEYAASLREIDKMQREHDADMAKRAVMVIEKQRELDQIAIEGERQKLASMRALGLISDGQEIEGEKKLEEKLYAIAVAAQKQKIAAEREGSKEKLKENQRLEIMEQQHANKMASYNIKAAQQSAAGWNKAFDSMATMLEEGFDSMRKGTLKFQHVWKSMSNMMLKSYGQMLKKMVTQHLSAMMAQVAAKQAGATMQGAIEEEATLKSLALNLMSTLKKINNFAISAAAGAYDAMADIPYVGPILGAVAAAVVYAGVMAFGAMASASGGYEIPAGVNPVTQLHQNEMVLPADLASGVKNIIRNGQTGGAAGGGNGDTHVHLHVNTVDAKGVKQFMKAHKSAVAGAALAHVRNLGSLNPVRGTR